MVGINPKWVSTRMSEESTADATEMGAEENEQQPQETKPTETVEFWKQKARENESKFKSNAAAAKRLAELEDAQKSKSEKAADRIAKAEAEVASVPSKVSEALRSHLLELHEIEADDAELFLTATDPELLLKQVTRLLGQSGRRKNHVPREGTSPQPSNNSEEAFVSELFGTGG